MFDFHEKRKIRSWLYSKPSIAVVLILTLWLSVSVFERYKVEREMAAKREEKQHELEALAERAAALTTKVEHLQDERGIEEELRSRFDVAKEGEQVVIIVDEEDSGAMGTGPSGGEPSGEDTHDRSFWDFLKFW